ncbi:MAG: heavy-metal-associated domain-containing protein [Pseudomonadota bacterium]
MNIEVLKVQELHDEAGAAGILQALEHLEGVQNVRVSLPNQRVTVRFDETVASPAQFSSVLAQAGFRTAPQERERSTSCCGGCCS